MQKVTKGITRRNKKKTRFGLDEMVTSISQAIYRDLHTFSSDTVCMGQPLKYVIERQRNELLKKFPPLSVTNKDKLEKLTFEKFLSVNEHMAKFRDVTFPNSKSSVFSLKTAREKILLRARALMHSTLFDFSEDELYRHCKHSGGVSLGVSFNDTSIEAKFTFPITITEEAIPLFDRYLNFNSSLKEAVKLFNGSSPVGEMYLKEAGSRATTVDKDDTIRRMIAIEPTGNMYLQQGLMNLMYSRMRRVGLDVGLLPSKHKKLAFEASITCENATIDFSSASDCVSIELLRWLLPPKWFRYFDIVRCKEMTVEGRQVTLNMASTMGNAVTFPLETLVFWTFAHAVRLTENFKSNALLVKYEDLGLCSVFGDDCIVPTSTASVFMETMSSVGFIVNKEKSYYGTEQFRESCGGDYLAGFNVRPYFMKGPTSTALSSLEPWLYIVSNSVLKKYVSYFGTLNYIYHDQFFRVLLAVFKKYNLKLKVVPENFPDDAGLKISSDILRFRACYAFNFDRIVLSNQGTYTLRYCRFVYRERRARSDGLRYCLWLNQPEHSDREPPRFVSTRRIGGYVVAKTTTAHWTIPTSY